MPNFFRRGPIIDFGQGLVRWCFRIPFWIFWRVRVHRLEKFPADGPLILLANHQSNMDPMIVGAISPRPINYLAKQSLFDFPPLGWFLGWNDCIPIQRDSNAIGGIKETLKRLKEKERVLIFPEGSRSADGTLQPIKGGFATLARRTKSPLLPLALDGAWQVYPRQAKFPLLGNIQVVFGDPIPYEQYAALSDDELSALVQEKIAEVFLEAQSRCQMSRMQHHK
jgi:1-acyl-sn-glycerol-3-phosphate acyltransferase